MNKLITIMFAFIAMIFVPSISYTHPYNCTYRIVERCYTVLFPYPHSRCEYVQVRRNYAPVIPQHHRHYRSLPQPAHRHGYHPPHHNGNHHHNGPRW